VRVYAQWEAEKLNRRRAYVQQLRNAAGLPEVDPLYQSDEAAERAVPGQLRLSFDIRLDDAEPKVLYLAAEAGKRRSFDLGDDVSAEVSPTLYADGSVFVFLRLFERGQLTELPLYELGFHSEAAMKREVILQGAKQHRIEIGCKASSVRPRVEGPTL
jgi:hypothetical protein